MDCTCEITKKAALYEKPEIENEIRKQKAAADYRILAVGKTKKRALFVCENETNLAYWISEKEESLLKAHGKTFSTDF